MLRWSVACDLFYGGLWLVLVLGVGTAYDPDTAARIGLLTAAAYFAGGVKYKHP